MASYFKNAKPVWVKGKAKEMNFGIELTHMLKPCADAKLILTGATFYQIFADNELIHYGPARKAHGYFGIDKINLPEADKEVKISIIVMGYNCKCFGAAKNDSFIQAEILNGEEVLAATGKMGFEARTLDKRIQKVMRYSYQRHFSECWDYTRENQYCSLEPIDYDMKYIGRNVPFFDYDIKKAKMLSEEEYILGDAITITEIDYPNHITKSFDYFAENELERNPMSEYIRTSCAGKGDGILQKWDFGEIEVGFFKIKINTKTKCRVLLTYSEQLDENGRISLRPLDSVNVIEMILPPGDNTFISFEPYTVRYAEVIVMEGEADITGLEIIELAYSANKIIPFVTADEKLMKIYDAAVKTFRHNAVDIYMDCPSRERAGWLFDSFYTAKAEYAFTGDCIVEDEFLNNYRLGGSRNDLKGLVDMCYPADVFSKNFIPQWSMWYILELYDYFMNRNRADKKELFREQIMMQVQFFEKYENEFGLLEKLDGWNFVERSALNHRVHDVSWPTNMLYSGFLRKVGVLYGISELIEKADKIKKLIENMAFDGRLFYDRAMRNEVGELVNADEYSETAQYYALYFDIADINNIKYKIQKQLLFNEIYLENIEPSDVMPGLYLKIELLLRYKDYENCKQSIIEYFAPMAEETGTLWEHRYGVISRDHGFASYIGAAIKQLSHYC